MAACWYFTAFNRSTASGKSFYAAGRGAALSFKPDEISGFYFAAAQIRGRNFAVPAVPGHLTSGNTGLTQIGGERNPGSPSTSAGMIRSAPCGF